LRRKIALVVGFVLLFAALLDGCRKKVIPPSEPSPTPAPESSPSPSPSETPFIEHEVIGPVPSVKQKVQRSSAAAATPSASPCTPAPPKDPNASYTIRAGVVQQWANCSIVILFDGDSTATTLGLAMSGQDTTPSIGQHATLYYYQNNVYLAAFPSAPFVGPSPTPTPPSRAVQGVVRVAGVPFQGPMIINRQGSTVAQITGTAADGTFSFSSSVIGSTLEASYGAYLFNTVVVDSSSPAFVLNGMPPPTPTPTPIPSPPATPTPTPTPGPSPTPTPTPVPGLYLSGGTFYSGGGQFNFTYIQVLDANRVELWRYQEQDSTYLYPLTANGNYIVRPMIEIWNGEYNAQPTEYQVSVCGQPVSNLNFTIGPSSNYPLGSPIVVPCASPSPSPTPTPSPTPSPSPTPLPTPTPSPTSTPTPAPSPSPTPPGHDVTPPTISITSPGKTVTRKTDVVFSVNASDNVGVTSVGFFVNGTPIGWVYTAPYQVTWHVPPPANTNYTLTAVARDAAGNATTTTLTVTAR